MFYGDLNKIANSNDIYNIEGTKRLKTQIITDDVNFNRLPKAVIH